MRAALTTALLLASAVALAQPTNAPPGTEPTEPATASQEAAGAQAAGAVRAAQERQRQAAAQRMAGRTPPLATAARDSSLPPGTIQVVVVDGADRPIPGAPVRVGVMAQGGARDAHSATTDESGVATLRDLPTGSDQAYRVSVDHQGARYGAPPFRLETDAGHRVRIKRLEVTRNTRTLLQVLGQTMLEYRNDRIHITEQTQLTNLGDRTIVFGDGLRYPLPTGFTAFQSPAQMTDQRIVGDEHGFLLKGSIPPGTVTLNWAYDVPLDGAEAQIAHDMPFRTYAYRVFSDAAEGMSLDVRGFPPAEVHTQQGRRLLITQLERSPEDPPFERLSIAVEGIPGPGPLRWIALGAALLLLFLAFLLGTRGGRAEEIRVQARAKRKEELLQAAVELGEAHARGEVGPKYHARRMSELVAELASLLRLDQASETLSSASDPDRR